MLAYFVYNEYTYKLWNTRSACFMIIIWILMGSFWNITEEELKFEEEEQMKRYLKFMVPDGKVIGLNPNDPSHISWQHKVFQ